MPNMSEISQMRWLRLINILRIFRLPVHTRVRSKLISVSNNLLAVQKIYSILHHKTFLTTVIYMAKHFLSVSISISTRLVYICDKHKHKVSLRASYLGGGGRSPPAPHPQKSLHKVITQAQ